MATLLTLAGARWDDGTGAYLGGGIVQLDSGGTWQELKTVAGADSVCWCLRDYIKSGNSYLFHIESTDTHLTVPFRGKLYVSDDQGATWNDVTPSSGSTEYVGGICEDALGNIWCITDEREDTSAVVGGPSRIYKSEDFGSTWTLKKTITDISFGTRYWPAFNIACDPTDANNIIVEGTEMVAWRIRLWKSTDGGDSWSAAWAPIGLDQASGEPYRNVGGVFARAMFFASDGSLIYPTRDFSGTNGYVKRSIDLGANFASVHSWALGGNGYGRDFQETGGYIYISCDEVILYSASADPTSWTEIADITDGAPWQADFNLNAVHETDLSGTDLIYVGIWQPAVAEPEEESVYQRPASLGSGWVALASWGSHETDLGYVLYVEEKGLVGATSITTTPTPEEPRPPRPESPPAYPGPAESATGVAWPGTGIQEKKPEQMPMRLRRRQQPLIDEVKTLPPRIPPFITGDQIDKRMPPRLMSPGPKIKKWLSFGWLIPVVLAGEKTLSLRNWGPIEAMSWQRGQLCYAYDLDPDKGGTRLALLRITHTPYKTMTDELRKSDFIAGGLMYAQTYGLRHPQGLDPAQIWADIHTNPRELWVVRYKVEQIYDQLAPTRGTVRIA